MKRPDISLGLKKYYLTHENPMLGKRFSEAWKKRKRLLMKGINLGNKNGMWKGNKVGLTSLHVWVKRRLKKAAFCQLCNKKPPYDLANISQKYKRDLTDWEWLCRSCHMKKDGRADKLNKIGFIKLKRICLECNKPFRSVRLLATRCSDYCRNKYWRNEYKKREAKK